MVNLVSPFNTSLHSNREGAMKATLPKGLGPVLALIVMSVTLSLVSPHFLTFDNITNVFRQSAINSLLALGQLLVIVTAGIDLSVGSIMGLCCVMFALLLKHGLPTLAALAAILLLGLGLGWINGLLLTMLKLPHPFISTLGMMNVARGAALIISGGFPISGLPDSARFLGAGVALTIPVPVMLVIALYGLFHVFLTRTVIGRDIFAIGGNQHAAWLSGIDVVKRLNLVYGLSGALAALAAIILAGRMNSGFPLAGVGAELDAIAAVIIGGASFSGGIGTVWGTLTGALIIGLLRNGLNLLNVSSFWQTVVIGIVIVVAVWIDVIRQRVLRARPEQLGLG
jgi:ribose transport system permease protein